MEIKPHLMKVKALFWRFVFWIQLRFFKQSPLSQKKEINLSGFKWVGLSALALFIAFVIYMPDEQPIVFSQKLKAVNSQRNSSGDGENVAAGSRKGEASRMWGNSAQTPSGDRQRSSNINYNTPMAIGSKFGNAKNQFRAGIRIPLKIVDKFVVSQDAVPILAESILDSVTDSGIKIPAGTRFYGEASFEHGTEVAQIIFKQISLPSGEIKPISALALGKDGQPGMSGKIHSDGVKNSTGQVITTFIGGLASGSMETDMFGHSKGGIGNGLLSAVADTAKTRAQNYGEKLKAERQWIEVESGTELDALLKETLNLNDGGNL